MVGQCIDSPVLVESYETYTTTKIPIQITEVSVIVPAMVIQVWRCQNQWNIRGSIFGATQHIRDRMVLAPLIMLLLGYDSHQFCVLSMLIRRPYVSTLKWLRENKRIYGVLMVIEVFGGRYLSCSSIFLCSSVFFQCSCMFQRQSNKRKFRCSSPSRFGSAESEGRTNWFDSSEERCLRDFGE